MAAHPTVEQRLHSIALSMIGIHKELKDSRRIQKDTLRSLKERARMTVTRHERRKTTVWSWLRDLITGGTGPVLGHSKTGPF